MEKIHDSVPEHLKCPICFEIPKDKVFQCRNGHIFCEDCYKKFTDKRCPQCRVFFPSDPIRCRAVEQTLDSYKLEFPCQFQSAGCEKKVERKDLVKHNSSCKYDFEKFGEFKKACRIFGFKNCSFAFNQGSIDEALAHFQSEHGMRSIKALLLDLFPIFYENLEEIYNSSEATVFIPLIFDQKWFGHDCIYIIVTRFNPFDKTLQFIPLYLVHGQSGPYTPNSHPKPVEFSLKSSHGTISCQYLLNCDEQTLGDFSYFAASLKKWFKMDRPDKLYSTLQIKLSQFNELQRPPFNKQDGLVGSITYKPWDVLTPSLLNEYWPALIRPICSVGNPQNWDGFRWIPYPDYANCKNYFSPTSSLLELNVLICRANINEKWVVGVIGIDNEKNITPPAFFNYPTLLNANRNFELLENFEILYTPPYSFEWIAWACLKDAEPLPVHDDERGLLICESRSVSGYKFIGAVKKDMQPDLDKNIYVLVSKSN